MEGIPAATNPLGLWLEAKTVSMGSAMVTQDELHAAYAVARTKANQPIVTKQMFGRTLKRLRPELREAQRTIGGRKRWVYLGIGMKACSVETLKKGGRNPSRAGVFIRITRSGRLFLVVIWMTQAEKERVREIVFVE